MPRWTPEQLSAARAAAKSSAESSRMDPATAIREGVDSLPEFRRAQAERIARSASPQALPRYFAALRGELSLRRAVNLFCLHCTGWEREEVKRCTAHGCPLWAYRPKFKMPATEKTVSRETPNS